MSAPIQPVNVNCPSICLGQSPTELTDTALHGPDARTRSLSWKSPTGWGSALARRGGRVDGTDRQSLSFVHQVPSNGEEHEQDSDNGQKIEGGNWGMNPGGDVVGVEKKPRLCGGRG